ncbi:MAG: hypothetical protein ABIW76_22735 [Fibrobacteria bacterium]
MKNFALLCLASALCAGCQTSPETSGEATTFTPVAIVHSGFCEGFTSSHPATKTATVTLKPLMPATFDGKARDYFRIRVFGIDDTQDVGACEYFSTKATGPFTVGEGGRIPLVFEFHYDPGLHNYFSVQGFKADQKIDTIPRFRQNTFPPTLESGVSVYAVDGMNEYP